MSASVLTLFTETTLDGFPLWVVLLICGGVFLAGFMDAIAGGGGIISVPVYLMAFSGLPTHFVLGTNKLSSCIGTAFSTARFIHQGYVHWRLFLPAAGLAVAGSVCGTQLQLHTPDVVLKYLLLAVLPVVAFSTLDEALAMANDSDYGLTSSIYTRDLNVAMKAIKGLKFGETYINRENFEAMQGFHAGWRKSGIGGADGRHGLNEYLQTQVVYLQA